MGKTLSMSKGPVFTEPGATVPNHGRLPLLLRAVPLSITLVAGPAGHPTEPVCASASARKTITRPFGRSPQTEKTFTRCFQDGTTCQPSVVAVGRPTGQ